MRLLYRLLAIARIILVVILGPQFPGLQKVLLPTAIAIGFIPIIAALRRRPD